MVLTLSRRILKRDSNQGRSSNRSLSWKRKTLRPCHRGHPSLAITRLSKLSDADPLSPSVWIYFPKVACCQKSKRTWRYLRTLHSSWSRSLTLVFYAGKFSTVKWLLRWRLKMVGLSKSLMTQSKKCSTSLTSSKSKWESIRISKIEMNSSSHYVYTRV